MEEVIIYAKPNIIDVIPYTIGIQPDYVPIENDTTITLIGKSFLNITNVYLSSNDDSIFSENTVYYSPFSAVKNLSSVNSGFYGIKITDYVVQNEKYITTNQSLSFLHSGFIDVIVENEAGFGILSRDSRVPFLSSWAGAIDIQKPSISGIEIKLL
jgi:hypothetical protein